MRNEERTISIAIFDDNRHIRESLELVLNNTDGMACTGAFCDCNNLLKDILKSNPDVVLMDIDMPGLNGIGATEVLRRQFPNLKIVMQTVYDQDDKIFDAICAGASGYVLKGTTSDELAETIRDVLRGGAPMSPPVAKKVLQMLRHPGVFANKKQQTIDLTEREKEILQLLVDGMGYKQVAEKLFISFFTVQTHIKHIYEKLQVNSKSEAVSKAFRERLL